jgi:YVTN family beta-propeller protein
MQGASNTFASRLFATVIASVACAAATPSIVSQTELAATRSGLINPQAIVYSPATGKVYSVDSDLDSVNISDDARGTTIRVKVGSGPVSIAVDVSTGRAYVANAGAGTVSALDGQTDAVVATIPVGSHPYSIAVNSITGKVYVTRTYSDELTIIDETTNTYWRIKTGSADLISVNPKANAVYLVGYEGGVLTTFDEANGTLKRHPAGMHLWGMTLNETSGTLYLARPGSADLIAFGIGGDTAKTIPVGAIPCAVAVNERTNEIYVADYGDASVSVIDGATRRRIAIIVVGDLPQAIAVDPVRNLVFVASTHSNRVMILDGGTHHLLDTVSAGRNPYALVVNPVSRKLHVANLGGSGFTIVDLKTLPHARH